MTSEVQIVGTKPERSIHYADSMEEIHALIKAHVPIIWVITHEEQRFIREFEKRITRPTQRQLWLWSAYQGLIRHDQSSIITQANGEQANSHRANVALEQIGRMTCPDKNRGLVFVMRDFHIVLNEPIPRQLRDMYDHIMNNKKTIIVTAPMLAHGAGGTKVGLPPTMEKQISVVHYILPNRKQIHDRTKIVIKHMKKKAVAAGVDGNILTFDDDQINEFARALQGLTLHEADNSLSTSVSHTGTVMTDRLILDKKQIIRKSDILEYVDNQIEVCDVGGLDQAKEYLSKYKGAYSDEAKAFGVEPLKGVLLTGVPGTGKSLLAKAIGKIWMLPLLRLDIGKVMSGIVGSSENRMRDVIAQAEAMSPCILWVDEVEKSLSGTKSSNFSDGGTLARVFGTLLTAMQDGLDGVTIIATSNDINALPAEFIRRFNEVFFVDLPGPDERKEIFEIHLRKRKKTLDGMKKAMSKLISCSDQFTGAEIEKAVKDAIAAAFYRKGEKKLTTEDLITALKDTKPIAKIMADKVTKLREKARGQYRYASSWAEVEATKRGVRTKKGKKIDIGDAIKDVGVFAKTRKEKAKEEDAKVDDRFDDVIDESFSPNSNKEDKID